MVEKGVPLAEFYVKNFLNEKYPPPKIPNYHKQTIAHKKGLILTDISDLGESGEKISGFCLPRLFISMFCLTCTWTRLENENSKY